MNKMSVLTAIFCLVLAYISGVTWMMWWGAVVAGLAVIQLFVSYRFRQKTIKENRIGQRIISVPKLI